MAKNYFAIERGNQCLEGMCIRNDNGEIMFEDVMNMSYEELKAYSDLEAFVCIAMDATNEMFKENDAQTCLTLVGEDGVFVWGIIMGPGDDDQINYCLVDWKKDGKSFRYEK